MNRIQIKRTLLGLQVAFVFFMGASIIVFFPGCGRTKSAQEYLSQAKIDLIRGDFDAAEESAVLVPPEDQLFQKATLIAGEACTKAGRLNDAVGYYQKIVDADPMSDRGLLATFSIAEITLQQGKLTRAEQLYRQVYDSQAGNLVVNERLAFLLSLTARRWEALTHYFVMIKSGEATYKELALAADVGRAIDQSEFLKQCQQRQPNDTLVRLAIAFRLAEDGKPGAIPKLRKIIQESPDLLAAQAVLGNLLYEAKDDAEFLAWHSSLPPSAETSPDIWLTRGMWARRAGDLDVSANCLLHAVKKTTFSRLAYYTLGQTFVASGSPHAGAVVSYAQKLTKLTQQIDLVLTTEAQNPYAVQEAALLLESVGRIWEACAWAVLGQQLQPNETWHSELLGRQSAKLNQQLTWVEPGHDPVESIHPQEFDFQQWLSGRLGDSGGDSKNVNSDLAFGKIQFEDSAAIKFQYSNADDPATAGMRMFEQTGGGVGILDLENDSCPDTYLVQGSPWKTGNGHPSPSDLVTDSLFRASPNIPGGVPGTYAFREVPAEMTSFQSSYGQGCAIGDFNNDGFDDIYVANVGQNRLLEGMGDGTFVDVTPTAGIADKSWTISVMVCDLNADGLPDLFDVNYVEGDGVYQKICNGKSCSPSVFDGAADFVWINQGDGTFQSMELPVNSRMAKGLGIVSFEGPARRRPGVFIANDQVANFLLTNQPADNEANLKLSNTALLTGLAYDVNGVAMACMGIAVDDFDSNGLPDLFVTNFQDEPNTLYLQDAPDMFRDSTRTYGLYAAGVPMTGWGVQPLDADLDGRPDLVVANGHVDDYTETGGSFRMKPHFYQQKADRFEQLTAEDVGPWFDGEYLGRGLARVDWNMDGRPDFIASLINQPVAVMLNTTESAGHFLKFKLKATTTARDAIGSLVTVKTKNRSITRQLFAGDGYMASNERIITFGLGTTGTVESVDIHWPSGDHTILDAPPVDQFYLVTEGASSATIHRLDRCRSVDTQIVPSNQEVQ